MARRTTARRLPSLASSYRASAAFMMTSNGVFLGEGQRPGIVAKNIMWRNLNLIRACNRDAREVGFRLP